MENKVLHLKMYDNGLVYLKGKGYVTDKRLANILESGYYVIIKHKGKDVTNKHLVKFLCWYLDYRKTDIQRQVLKHLLRRK